MRFIDTLKEFPKTWEEFTKQYIFNIYDKDKHLSLNVGNTYYYSFENLPFKFQLGVLLAFLEEYNIRPVVDSLNDHWGFGVHYYDGRWKTLSGMNYNTTLTTRAQAYQKAISKAFKLLEEK